MTFSKKHTAIPLSLILICIIARGFLVYSMSIAPFAAFCKELAIDTLTDNPFELHYSVAYPEKMGLEDLSTNLIPFHPDFYMEGKELWTNRLDELSKISSRHLNEKDSFLCDILMRHTNLQLEALDYPYYENPISCSGGVQSQIPILLSEYALRSKTDIENYFLLLCQIPTYLNGIGEYTKNQERNGIYIYEVFLQETVSQCRELFPQKQLEQNTHFLQTSFHKRLEALKTQNIISEAEMKDYETRNTSLLCNKIAPAYQQLAEAISSLDGTPKLCGLSDIPKGKEYYSFLLRTNTGSDKSVDALKSMLYKRYDMMYKAYKNLADKGTYVQNWTFPVEGYSAMLEHLYEQAKFSFPDLDALTGNLTQKVSLKTVDGILAGMSAPAFYMTPPIDANAEHIIYINPDAQMNSLDLYTTLAHEGFPGHLYQTVYSQTALNTAHAPLLRQLLYYGGYTEGWAVYAELYSYDFVKKLAQNNLSDTIELSRLNREIQLCLCSILDIYIHYDGASLEDTAALLKKLGLNSANASVIYEAICDAPANYPKYYIGYLEILELKNAAKNLWGEAYSDMKFHEWFLTSGPADFSSLTQKLNSSSKN